jgi:hypothetical protein
MQACLSDFMRRFKLHLCYGESSVLTVVGGVYDRRLLRSMKIRLICFYLILRWDKKADLCMGPIFGPSEHYNFTKYEMFGYKLVRKGRGEGEVENRLSSQLLIAYFAANQHLVFQEMFAEPEANKFP